MSTFCFVNEKTKEVIEEDYLSYKEVPEKIKRKGRVFVRSVAAEIAGQTGNSADTWPLESTAMGVHPSQVDEYEAYCEKVGLNTKYNRKNSRAIFRDQAHRKAHCEHFGATDLDGGYNDPFCSDQN